MGIAEKGRVHVLSAGIGAIPVLVILAISNLQCFAGSTILYDFENGTEGWQNESARPVPALVTKAQSRHGQQSLAFTHSFSKSFSCLQCRVKEGFPKDFSTNSFRGFSAWIYIPKGKPNWDMKMFVRCGENWAWAEGPTKRGMEPGWQKVEITHDKIPDLSSIQDIGVQVFNFREQIEATICIDQVEMITQDSDAGTVSQ